MPSRRAESASERPKALSEGEESLALHLKAYGLSYEREVCLVPGRKYRWDFCVKDLAIEVQGGTWRKGGHSSGLGILRDARKTNAATIAGYRVLIFTTDMVKSGEAIDTIRKVLQSPRTFL